jgi:lysophospholipid acyltransferase (LPLAT)-like uncharacterized protein
MPLLQIIPQLDSYLLAVPNQKKTAYQFADLSEYSLKQRVQIRLADFAFFLSIKILGRLTRFEIRGQEHLDALTAAGKLPIIGFWHDRIFLGTYFFRDRGIVVMTSKSFDGEYIARFIQRLGYGSIRGSSSRGGAIALIEMIKSMRTGLPMALTLDGPRGPRYVAKTGALILAKKTGNPVLPFVVEAQNFWTVNSWDKMQIPRPFTRAIVIVGEPIYVDADTGGDEIELKLIELQGSLNTLVEQGRRWRES